LVSTLNEIVVHMGVLQLAATRVDSMFGGLRGANGGVVGCHDMDVRS
jgi:hypothetical protein